MPKNTTQKVTVDLIINDEQIINDRGYNILNAGLDRQRYDRNPVLFYQHDRERVIGRCTNLRIEGGRLIGSFEFDEEDPVALEVKRKVDGGFLHGVSPGLYIKDMEMLEERWSVTNWELIEVSIVTIPSNMGAVKLYGADGAELSAEEATRHIESLCALPTDNTTNQSNTMSKITPTPETTIALSAAAYTALKLDPNASIDALNKAIVALSAECDTLRTALETTRTAQRDALISEALTAGKITESNKQRFVELYDKDVQLCASILAEMPAPQSLSAQLRRTPSSSTAERFAGSWDDLDRDGKLADLKATDRELFNVKFRERFGCDYGA